MPAIAHQNKILGNTSGGGSTILVTTSESTLYGQTVTLSDGTTTLTGTFSNAGECEFTGVMMVGTLTASSGTASTSINVPYFGVYSIILSLFSATITATYPEDKGATCTCTGNGESYTASGSPYTFTVHGAGEYRVTATLDGKSITDVIQITTDGQSETATINFGTIVVTYDNAFRGLPITCTKDSSVYTKTAPSSGNTMYFYPNITGNWVISGTVSGTSYSKTANVTSLSTSVSVSLETVPNGSTVLPTDDIETWLACGQITGKSYTTLSQVLADAETYERLLSDSNACDYMKRSTTWSTDICADADAMMRLGKYDYACDALLADSTWASAIVASTYADYVIDTKVPTMTSNTAPSGTAFASTEREPAYYAFDGNDTTYYGNNQNALPCYVGYTFTSAVKVAKVYIKPYYESSQPFIKDFKIQGSNDNFVSDVNDLYTGSFTTSETEKTVVFECDTPYTSYRLYVSTVYNSPGYCSIKTLQFYGRHTAQTDIIVTAHGGDTVYYMENGSPVTLTTADSDTGIGTVDWSDLPKGAITLYSSTAKNPSDLTADYSKTVYITENTTQIYLMPDNALYWWGYLNNFGSISTANGWSSSVTFVDPIFDTNSCTTGTTSPGKTSGFGTINAVTTSGIHAIVSAKTVGLGSCNFIDSKNINTYTSYFSTSGVSSANTIQHLSNTGSSNTGFMSVRVAGNVGTNATTLYAMWYE